MKKYSRRAIGMCRTATSAFGAFIRNSALSSASSGLRRQGRCECVAGTWCVSLAKSKQNSPATGGCQRIVERHRHRRIADIVIARSSAGRATHNRKTATLKDAR